ncbi:MAG: MBL fold metallo-hydrolase [Lachnospiraceae bacterium]|nr:MBL fold metallo-hydrolase [Lachnospiraceae bacterium]
MEMIEMMRYAKCDAVLFTHYHGDHIGLLEDIPEKDVDGKSIRLGMGRTARQVLLNIHKTLAEHPQASDEDKKRHNRYISILTDKDRRIDIIDDEKLRIGDFEITPIMVDHSAYDAYMFIIKVEGKIIVHTGDYRTHGRLGRGFFDKLKARLKGTTVDVLITEGTMMSRLGETVITEENLQKRAMDVLSKPENRYAFLVCSSTNVESLASFANAAMYLGRAFYVNYYVYEQVLLYRETAGADNPVFRFWKTYKFESMKKYNPKLGMTQPEFMRENGFLMLIGSSPAYDRRISEFKADDPLLIYSMWGGYVKKGTDNYDEDLGRLYHGWPEERRVDLHTSGHATADDIRQMILTVKPEKAIVPIHTESPELFSKLDIGRYKDKVIAIEDSKIVNI